MSWIKVFSAVLAAILAVKFIEVVVQILLILIVRG